MDCPTTTTHGEELPQNLVEAIHKLVQEGASQEMISSVLGLKLEAVQQAKDPSQVAELGADHGEVEGYKGVLSNTLITSSVMGPEDIYSVRLEEHTSMPSELAMLNPNEQAKSSVLCSENSIYSSKDPQDQRLYADTLPTFIYSYNETTDQLHRTNLVTGEQSSCRVNLYKFKSGCCWSEVPGGSLLITGGGLPAVKAVVRIRTCREFAVSRCPPMLTPRRIHAAVYHTPHLYILGGLSGSDILRECERYECEENRWEELPPLPRACYNSTGVVVEGSLYALGGGLMERS
jgi:hypothetical protein